MDGIAAWRATKPPCVFIPEMTIDVMRTSPGVDGAFLLVLP